MSARRNSEPDGSVVIASNPPVVFFYATGDGGGQAFGPIPVP